MTRLFIFESHPVQYHAPVYRALHEELHRSGHGAVHVYYATDAPLRGHFDPGFGRIVAWDEPLLAGYPSTVLNRERGVPLSGFRSLSGRGVMQILREGRPDAVLLTGLAYEFDWAVYLAALRLGIPVWLRTETQDHAFPRSPIKDWVRRWVYRIAYKPVSKALVIGRLNAEHYERHGLSSKHHALSRYCVVDRFSGRNQEPDATLRRDTRRFLEVSDDVTLLLFCGKLQPKKNPMSVLDALAGMSSDERARFAVLFVGTGAQEGELKARAAQVGGVRVHFVGFQNQTQISKWYLASDVLVLPSCQMGETWGLVVNEALMAECRVVISRHVGCHADFRALPSVRVFDGSVSDLLRALRDLPPVSATCGQRAFMRDYSIEAAAHGIALLMQDVSAGGSASDASHSVSEVAPSEERSVANAL